MVEQESSRAMSFQDRIIAEHVKGHTFVDVGGIWGTVNEKVSVALAAGASRATVVDVIPTSHELWRAFDDRVKSLGFHEYGRFGGINLDAPDVASQIGQFEFVHCAGIVYHVPSPMWTLERLHSVTSRFLLLGSMVVPDKIATPAGNLEFTGGKSIYIPALDDATRAILASHFAAGGLKIMHINSEVSEPFRVNDKINYGPWWWLYSAQTLKSMIELSGLKVLDVGLEWGGRVAYYFCERT